MRRTGGTRTILCFAREFSRMGNDVSIVTSYHDNWFPLPSDVRIVSSPRVVHLAWFLRQNLMGWSLRWDLKLVARLAGMIPRGDYNIATFGASPYAVSLRPDAGIPIHHMQNMDTDFAFGPAQARLFRDALFLPMTHIANSSWLASEFTKLTGRTPPVLNPAVQHEIYYPRPKKDDTDSRTVRILALGKRGKKNVDHVIQAVYGIYRQGVPGRDIELVLFGNSVPRGLPQAPFIRFYKSPSDDELARLYSSSTVYVSASSSESFPGPQLEAMACGCPVVTTSCGSEDFCFDRQNSLVIAPGDLKGLETALREVVVDEDLRNRLAANGLRTARSFTYASQAQRYYEILKSATAS